MKNSLIILLSLIFSTASFAQTEPCDSTLLNKEFALNFEDIDNLAAIIEGIKSLNNCGLAEADIEYFLIGPPLGEILIEIGKEGSFTMNDLLNYSREISKREGYAQMRDQMLLIKGIADKTANLENWKRDRLIFKSMGAPEEDLNEMESWIKASDGTLSYAELTVAGEQQEFATAEITSPAGISLWENKNMEYEVAMQKAIYENKPLLLYFTEAASINARKMEKRIITLPDIKKIISENFVFVPLHVDDPTPLSTEENEALSTNRNKIISLGDKLGKFQLDKFGNNSRPCFVILNHEEIQLEMIGYVDKKERFIDFLVNGIDKFHE